MMQVKWIKKINVTDTKKTVEKYMDAFRRTDHHMILNCLTDDVISIMPGGKFFHLQHSFRSPRVNLMITP
jgi:hypothetical protein